jgi:leader peptidase (prepilin peptidase)/N-methyltransferase
VSGAAVDAPRETPRAVGIRIPAAFAAAVLVLGCFVRFGFSGRALVGAMLCVVLVALSVTDLETRLIPNRIVLPATALVLVAQLALYGADASEFVIAAVAAGLFLLLPLLVYPAGMGMGDVKLAVFLGAALGRDVIDAFVVGFFLAAAVAVSILLREGSTARKHTIAFGPYLAVGGIAALFFGESIVRGVFG